MNPPAPSLGIYLLKRVLTVLPLLIVISFLAFVLVRVAPGGPFDRERAPSSPEVERQLKARYHLDEPVWKQFTRYLSHLARGDFGPSLHQRDHSVNDIIAQALPVSLTLGLSAFLFAIALGVPLGAYAAIHHGQARDWISSFIAISFVCVPALVIGPVLTMIFAIRLPWLPVALLESPAHLVLPVITLGLYYAGKIARITREGLLGTLQAEFITAARARGLRSFHLYFKHALRIGILPVVSYSGPLLADLLTGSFVVENIFQIPGLGVFIVNGSLSRDYTMIVGLVILYAALLLVLNLLVDLACTLLDPRVRL